MSRRQANFVKIYVETQIIYLIFYWKTRVIDSMLKKLKLYDKNFIKIIKKLQLF